MNAGKSELMQGKVKQLECKASHLHHLGCWQETQNLLPRTLTSNRSSTTNSSSLPVLTLTHLHSCKRWVLACHRGKQEQPHKVGKRGWWAGRVCTTHRAYILPQTKTSTPHASTHKGWEAKPGWVTQEGGPPALLGDHPCCCNTCSIKLKVCFV